MQQEQSESKIKRLKLLLRRLFLPCRGTYAASVLAQVDSKIVKKQTNYKKCN